MNRRIPVLIVGFALVLVVRSDEKLKCYMCTSLTNEGCDTDPKAHDIKPVECTMKNMVDWQLNVQQYGALSAISRIFEVDNSQQYQTAAPMACAKMVLMVDKQEVTVRNCQTAKTETIDPCRAIQGKFSSDLYRLEHCDLCTHDACNSSVAISARIFLVLLSLVGSVIFGGLYNRA
ncbi:uncharacterized protein LOC122401611 [Colletes gigas]|uniref:uncharacterized protein LOC122401611 n=1 Tax=Colletes gigas TaxID=935657 RepID=UPI001C9AC5B4|nr:uncharacterized protein LOC122401611 [Colletes gigas]